MSAVAPLEAPAGQVFYGLPAEEYHCRTLGEASSSILRMLRDKTPAHVRAWYDGLDEDPTPAMVFGRAYHARVLEPDTFAERFSVLPDFGPLQSSKNRAARDEWLAERPGLTVLSRDALDKIEAMHAALVAHPVVAGIIRDGVSEVTMRWQDEETGVACKARADWYVASRGFFMDLKTTEDASPTGFARSIEKYGYHIQHAHYAEGARVCGLPIKNYLIVAQEKEAPYLPAVYHLDAASEQRGFAIRDAGLRTLQECMASGQWPGYPGITEIALPAWAMGKSE